MFFDRLLHKHLFLHLMRQKQIKFIFGRRNPPSVFSTRQGSLDDIINTTEARKARREKVRRAVSFLARILGASFMIMLLLFAIALVEGIGYSKSFQMVSKTLIRPNHPCDGTVCKFNLSITFNPFLYLVSYANGTGHISGVRTQVYYPPLNNIHIPTSAEIEEKVVGTFVWSEAEKNLPYLFAVALALSIVVVKTIQITRSKVSKKSTDP